MKAWIGNLRDGRRLTPVPVTQCAWSVEVDKSDITSIEIPLRAKSDSSDEYQSLVNDARLLDPLNTITLGKTYLVVEDSGQTVGGPVMSMDYDADTGLLTVSGSGMWTYFDARTLLPPAAQNAPIVKGDGTPDPSMDTIFTANNAISIRTIAKRIVQQAVSWTNSVQCITYEDDIPGKSEKTYRAVNLITVGSALTNITRLLLGCDVGFFPRRQADDRGFEWMLRTGDPRLGITRPHEWDFTSRQRDISALSGSADGSRIATRAWFTGGKSSDKTYIETATNDALVTAGAPIWEVVDSSHGTVEDPATLLDMAKERVRTSFQAISGRSFKVARTAIDLHVVNVGDWCQFKTKDDPFFGSGWHKRRIQSMAASTQDPFFIQIDTGALYEGSDVDPDAPSDQGDSSE